MLRGIDLLKALEGLTDAQLAMPCHISFEEYVVPVQAVWVRMDGRSAELLGVIIDSEPLSLRTQ